MLAYRELHTDLGVTVSSPLSFNSYMDDVVGKAFRRLGLICKLFNSKSPKTIVRLYKSFVLPILEYASVIWNPYTKTYTNKIERVQKRMCRMVPKVRHLSYRNQLQALSLLSLEAHRIRYQLIVIFKLQKGITDMNFGAHFTRITNKKREVTAKLLQYFV